jgi:hypothetical protein
MEVFIGKTLSDPSFGFIKKNELEGKFGLGKGVLVGLNSPTHRHA